MEADGDKETFDGSSKALLGLHARVYKETSYAPRLTLIKRIPTRKGPLCQETDVNPMLL